MSAAERQRVIQRLQCVKINWDRWEMSGKGMRLRPQIGCQGGVVTWHSIPADPVPLQKARHPFFRCWQQFMRSCLGSAEADDVLQV
jgi:hypothetical protein